MSANRSTMLLTALAMFAFAANSVLCRVALRTTTIDPASFTAVRLAAAAAALYLLTLRRQPRNVGGNWPSALALFAYAAAFSFAYVRLPTGVGALLLFGAVQATMVARGVSQGERVRPLQAAGMAVAIAGLVVLLIPNGIDAATPVLASALMLLAGVAWGVYSLRGRGTGDPAAATRGNFIRSLPFAAVLVAAAWPTLRLDAAGILLAVVSGAITSGMGYIVWYAVMKRLPSTQAATVQLSVPAIAAASGAILLGETLSAVQLAAGAAIIGGIWLTLRR
jgi:drug/metabolite transporter (DMT)-like permease